MDDLGAKLRQTFHGHAAEEAAKQQRAATVREAVPEAVAPAAQSLRAESSGAARSTAPDIDNDLLREGSGAQTQLRRTLPVRGTGWQKSSALSLQWA